LSFCQHYDDGRIPGISQVGAMYLSSLILSATAVVLFVGARLMARWRRRGAVGLIVAAVGLTGLGLGLPIGRALDQFERLEQTAQQPFTTAEVERKLLATLFPNGVIQTAPPDERSVCHDWTFGGTRYSDGCPVATLLADYEAVTVPRSGDAVVYWEPPGEPVHSGIVRAVGAGGLVVIESKWGHLGRYLHLTGISHFPSRFTYYHRKGNGKSLAGGTEATPAADRAVPDAD
jgi:hypothetical protein